jgi:hypothetical protein
MTENDLIFDIPNDPAVICELLDQIKNADFINGILEAPIALLASKQAVGHTGYKVSRFSDIRSIVHTLPMQEETQDFRQKRHNESERKAEGLLALLAHRKYPGFVIFDQAGYDSQPMGFEKLQEFARAYVNMGYRGTIHYDFGRLYRGEYWETDALVSVWIGGTRQNPPIDHAHSIGISWNSRGAEVVGHLVEFCRKKFQAP